MIQKSKKCRFCEAELTSGDDNCSSCGLSQRERTLVDWEIKKLIERDIIIIDPILSMDEQLGPVGIDLRLDIYFMEFLHMKERVIDLAKPIAEHEFYFMRELEIGRGEPYFVQPCSFVLGQSLEYISIPSYIYCTLGGRSSLSKFGIEVHATAARVDPGFKGHLTFELKNVAGMPVKLYPLRRVANLMFHLTCEVEKPYKGYFQHQVRIKPLNQMKIRKGGFAILNQRGIGHA